MRYREYFYERGGHWWHELEQRASHCEQNKAVQVRLIYYYICIRLLHITSTHTHTIGSQQHICAQL